MSLEEQFKKEAKDNLKKYFRRSIEKGYTSRIRFRANDFAELVDTRKGQALYTTLENLLNMIERQYIEENIDSEIDKVEDKFYRDVDHIRKELK